MSELKYCQGPICHEHKTKDRIRGPKGSKRYETRRRSSFYYGGNFCSLNCQDDWFRTFGNRAVDHFGRITEAKVLTKDNAWAVRRNWNYNAASNTDSNYYAYNYLTEERRDITEQQYDNENTITPNGQLNI